MNETKIIVISNQKGGIGKTFSSCILAQLLSTSNHKKISRYNLQRLAKRVLVVDTDFQGNSTKWLTGIHPREFEGKSVMEAINELDASSYIHQVRENLYVLPATRKLSEFDALLTLNWDAIDEPEYLLSKTLEKVKDQFDYIIIDTAPSLSKMTYQALNTNFGNDTYLIIPMQTEDFGLDSVHDFSETLADVVNSTNPNLRLLGILPILADAKTNVDQNIIRKSKESFGDLVFETVIKRKAALKQMVGEGFSEESSKQRKALQEYYELLNEVNNRV
jgi:chromosome partitioning protein